jgi:hypothetical protein
MKVEEREAPPKAQKKDSIRNWERKGKPYERKEETRGN